MATTISTRLSKVEENNGKLTTSVKELKEYMKKFCKTSFVVKGSQYEVFIDVVLQKRLFIKQLHAGMLAGAPCCILYCLLCS